MTGIKQSGGPRHLHRRHFAAARRVWDWQAALRVFGVLPVHGDGLGGFSRPTSARLGLPQSRPGNAHRSRRSSIDSGSAPY